ncbi:MAG: hypothetical protein KJO34_14945, partial [Deltaproteobacteria bacterium]|nr:hypothetical protein [Deltaproteobacteria bacterium]
TGVGSDNGDSAVPAATPRAGDDVDGKQTFSHDLGNTPISLSGALADQRIFVGQTLEFSIPQGAFQHSDPAETLKYSASLPDGSPLPEFIQFDSQSGSFNVTAPPGVVNLDIVVTAYDSVGNMASTTFSIFFEEAEEDDLDQIASDGAPNSDVQSEQQSRLQAQPKSFDGISDQFHQGDESSAPSERDESNNLTEQEKEFQDVDADREVAAGKASLTEQIRLAGHFGYQQDRNDMLDSLVVLFSDEA